MANPFSWQPETEKPNVRGTFLGPEFEEERALQDKHVPILGVAEAEQHPFEAVLGEYESEIRSMARFSSLCRIEALRFLILESGN